MNILTLLTQDHRNLTPLFARAAAAAGEPEELVHVRDLVSEHISRHAAVEEQLLYPALLEQAGDDRPAVLRALEDHHAAETLLAEALQLPAADERLPAKLSLLADDVTRHLEHEEQELFDLARRTLTEPRLEELGEQAERVKAMAPTQPHPHMTGKPAWQAALALPVHLTDKALTTSRKLVGQLLGSRADGGS
ncbi:MAG: hemerythrin domain-containing protein [Actinobacteria bacterium]|nr:hemerythrin domain-containing protein [Actinomycetota bacterium]